MCLPARMKSPNGHGRPYLESCALSVTFLMDLNLMIWRLEIGDVKGHFLTLLTDLICYEFMLQGHCEVVQLTFDPEQVRRGWGVGGRGNWSDEILMLVFVEGPCATVGKNGGLPRKPPAALEDVHARAKEGCLHMDNPCFNDACEAAGRVMLPLPPCRTTPTLYCTPSSPVLLCLAPMQVQVSFEKLLDVFWEKHDPTQLNRQGNDSGTQYRWVAKGLGGQGWSMGRGRHVGPCMAQGHGHLGRAAQG